MHIPVLFNEVIEYLQPAKKKRFIDATFGEGGHAKGLARMGAEVLCIDRDPEVVYRANKSDGINEVVLGDFRNLKALASSEGFIAVDGILFDLGLGSHQLDDGLRGFSFQKEGPLDMRFDQTKGKMAGELVNFYPEQKLVEIIKKYGEERRFAKRIAKAILEKRKNAEIQTTLELFEIIQSALPSFVRYKARDAARKVFQALRIAVNAELMNLSEALPQALNLVKRGGRVVVISFHSLEDRIVKKFFAEKAKNCVCPPEFPVCRCDARAKVRLLTKKPVTATEIEIKSNSRAKSAKLRAVEKIWDDFLH